MEWHNTHELLWDMEAEGAPISPLGLAENFWRQHFQGERCQLIIAKISREWLILVIHQVNLKKKTPALFYYHVSQLCLGDFILDQKKANCCTNKEW